MFNPNDALLEARQAMNRHDPDIAPGEDVDNDDNALFALEKFMELDRWISRGGFLPSAWLYLEAAQ